VVLVRAASGWVPSAPTFVPYGSSAPWYRFREWDGIVKKGMLLVTLARGCTDETIAVVDTHLQTEYAYFGRDYAELRRRQLEQLDATVRARFLGMPVLIGGDFNTAPKERSGLYASHFARLGDDRTVDERAACGCGTRPPGSYRVASRWLDYVLTQRLGARATAVRITNDWVDRPFSDHDGVLVRLEGEMP
jgi:endonuclease/exonuclease/phosphatase family metal-dependent hydrolase